MIMSTGWAKSGFRGVGGVRESSGAGEAAAGWTRCSRRNSARNEYKVAQSDEKMLAY